MNRPGEGDRIWGAILAYTQPSRAIGPTSYRNGMGSAALVVGVVALVLAGLVILFPIAFVLGILAIIFGVVGMRRATRGEANNRGHAVAGLTCGVIALVLSIYLGIRLSTFVVDNADNFRQFWTCITSAPTEPEQEDCTVTLARQLEGEDIVG
jgi:uncharacterized membrane protein HdeD (DUF308 family)